MRKVGFYKSVVSSPSGLFPVIVCLCGSTKFGKAFQEANLKETLNNKIVLSVGSFVHDDETFAALSPDEQAATKRRLDELHLRKLDLCDEALFLNVGDYLGESSMRELIYARQANKKVRFLEWPSQWALEGEEAA